MKKALLTMAIAMGAITISQAQVLPFNKQDNKSKRVSNSETSAAESENHKVNLQVQSVLADVKMEIVNGMVLPELETPEEVEVDSLIASDNIPEVAPEPEKSDIPIDIFDIENKHSTENPDFSNADIYLVVGAFEIPENAAKLQNQMSEKGIQSQSLYNKERNLHYIYVEQAGTIEEAEQNILRIRRDVVPDAWIYVKIK
ncbi:MAG: SPOR domain-containing protein [Bacteroidia bacterium]